MENRIKKFRQILSKRKLDGFIVTGTFNIFYLSGFRGVSTTEREAILIFNPRATLIAPKLYQAEALRLTSNNLKVTIADERNRMSDLVVKLLKNAKSVGFEEHDLKYSEYKAFKKKLTGAKLVSCKNLIEDLRVIKTADEINKIEKAQTISQEAFLELVKTIKVGQKEAELAEFLAKIIKSYGGQGLAFESIVASGKNAALPHHKTGNRKTKKGDVMLVDFGAKYQGYCADLTRTVFVGKAHDAHRNIYLQVEAAQKRAIEKVGHGVKSHVPHAVANDVFKTALVEKNFLHSLGHGIGLEVHESPHLGYRPKDQRWHEKLMEGMVFSIEPGLYFPAWGGVRIEDLVTIEKGKARVLGKHFAEFLEIG